MVSSKVYNSTYLYMTGSDARRSRNYVSQVNLVSTEPTAARRRDIQILHRKRGVRTIFASFQTRILHRNKH